MKKLIVSVIALVALAQGLNAQESFFEAIEKLEGQDFQDYHSSSKIEGKDGHYRPGGENTLLTFKIERLASGRPYNLIATDKTSGRGASICDQLGYWSIDHQTYPAYVTHNYTGDVYLFFNGMLLEIKGLSDDGLSFKDIGTITAIVKEVEESTESEEAPKKKMSMKEKLAAAKAKMSASGASPMKKEIMDMNLDELVTEYLAQMKAKQKSADAAQEVTYVAEMKATAEMRLAERQKVSQELSQKMSERDSYTIVNETGSELTFVSFGGVPHCVLQPGESKEFDCHTDMYSPVPKGNSYEAGELIYNAEDNCNKTIVVK